MNSRERIFREVVAAIVGSKLKANDLRHFSELLLDEPSFARDLAHIVHDISFKLSPQGQLAWSDNEVTETYSDGGLTELAYSVVQRRRLSKDKLFSIFRQIAPEIRWSSLMRELSVREIVSRFLEMASTEQTHDFLHVLGMEVGEDPYLGGISSRSRK